MNRKSGLIIAAWALSCGSAFLIGRTSSQSTESSRQAAHQNSENPAGTRSTRDASAPDPGNRKVRRGDSRSETSSTPAQIADLEAKVRDLKNLSDPLARAEGFLELVRNLSPDQYLAVVAAYREGGISNEQFGEYRLLLTSWAQVNPLEALAYAKENTNSSYARQTILAAWAKNDSESAISWALDNFDNEGDDTKANPWMVGVITGIASTDLGRATQLLEELPFSRGRAEALDAIFKEVTANGNEDAKRWIAQLTDPKLKEGAASRLAGLIANQDPQSAADWAATLGPDIMKRAAGTIVDRWAASDLSAAQAWVDRQAQDIVAASGPNLVQKMIQQEDTATAANWLADYEGDPAFDDSVRSLVWHSMKDDPSTAADWIMKLTSPQDQERTFHRVLRGWMQDDNEGAMEYINNNPVPESIRRRAGMTE
jgi:hypothetical protein